MSEKSGMRELSYSGVIHPIALTEQALEHYYSSEAWLNEKRVQGTSEDQLRHYKRERTLHMLHWSACSVRSGVVMEIDRPISWKEPVDPYCIPQVDQLRVTAERVVEIYAGFHKDTWAQCKLVRVSQTWLPEKVILKPSHYDRLHRFDFIHAWEEVARYDIFFWVPYMNSEPTVCTEASLEKCVT